MKIVLPSQVSFILTLLQQADFEAYVVGGCVRDALRGVQPHDWDICTSARANQIKMFFKSRGYGIAPTGLNFGTVMVLDGKTPYEISEYKRKGKGGKAKKAASDLGEDLLLRDFTVNAIAYSPEKGFVDPTGGITDLQNGVLRCPGSAVERFTEDPLRILRALRFSATLNLAISSDTGQAMHELKHLLKKVAVERIRAELYKLFDAPGERVAPLLETYSDIIFVLMPELQPMFGFDQNNRHHIYDVWMHSLKAVEACPAGDHILQAAVLLHDAGKPQVYTVDDQGVGHFYGHAEKSVAVAAAVMNRLRFDAKTCNKILALVKYHDVLLEPVSKCMRRWLNRLGLVQLRRLLQLKRCDLSGQNPELMPEKIKYVEALEDCLNRLLEEDANPCVTLRDLKINGADLMALGYEKGPALGACLNRLLSEVLDEHLPNEHQALLQQAREWL